MTLFRIYFPGIIASVLFTITLPFAPLESQTAAPLSKDEKQKLFEKVFGKKQIAGESILPVYLDKRELFQAEIKILDTEILIDRKALEENIQPFITPLIFNSLLTLTSDKTFLGNKDLKKVGITLDFNRARLEVYLKLSGEIRTVTTIHAIAATKPKLFQSPTFPSNFSAYVNAYVSQRFIHPLGHPFKKNQRDSFSTVMTSKAHLYHWTLESEGSYQEQGAPKLTRGTIRSIRDFPNSMVRLNIGDLDYKTSGVQSFLPIGGIGISKNFELQPYSIVTPISKQEFYLKERSQVEVWSNGRFVQSLNLSPGPYNLYNLPVTQGFNDITLEITGSSGQETTIHLNLMEDIRLLRQGLNEYSYNIGYLSEQVAGRWHYKKKEPTLSLYQRYGLFRSVTIGGFAQGNKDRSMYGANIDLAAPFGLMAQLFLITHI